MVPRAASAVCAGTHSLHARPLEGQRQQERDPRRGGTAVPVQSGGQTGNSVVEYGCIKKKLQVFYKPPLRSNQVFILEELLSPIVTPFILIFLLRNKSLEIIDFFRNFTVEVVGVGDICSFAQMDIRRHGNPTVRLI